MGSHGLSPTLRSLPNSLVLNTTVRRRLRTIPTVVVGALIATAAMPLWLVGAVTVDSVLALARRKPFMATRLYLFGLVYLWAEVIGLVAAWWVLVTHRQRAKVDQYTYRVQTAWATQLLKAVKAIFGLRIDVTGADSVTPGPILVLARHTSLVDNLLPAAVITVPHGITLRYVLKKELLVDPALDVVGNRLPNAFVDRGRDSSESLQQIGSLARDLGPNEGVLLFPEGTRYTPAKLQRTMRILKRRSPRTYELAGGLRSVMPPHSGGVLALLDASDADVVILAHRGLDGFASVKDIWRGSLVGKTIDVHMWRVPASDIPTDRTGRVQWLFDLWREVDDWINQESSVPEPS